jgi:hypothetical protein
MKDPFFCIFAIIFVCLFLFLMIAIATGIKWNLIVAVICISFVAKNVEISSSVYWPFVLP